MEDREVWRTVPSLPDYIASSWGRIMRIPYRGAMPNGGARAYGGVPWIGAWSEEDQRYIIVFRSKTYKVAQLVCEAFHGQKPFAEAVCMHGDESSRNNRPENLAWGTQLENLNAPGFIAYCHSRTGENSPTVKARRKRELA